MQSYRRVHKRSISQPEALWAEAAEAIEWDRPWDSVLDAGNPPFYHWFRGGRLNTCHNAVDRHVRDGRGQQLALIHDSPVTQSVTKFTYDELLDRVARFAGVLRNHGVEKGDRVVLYMPVIPEAVVAMLACARIGAVHSVVFGGFAARELATRIDDAEAKVVVAASCGLEPSRTIEYGPLLEAALRLGTHRPEAVIMLQRPMAQAEIQAVPLFDWHEAMESAEAVECVSVEATDPLYILYTSGTTGVPKGVLRDNGGHAVALSWSMKNVYGVDPGDVFWAASDIGWVVGHSYIVYGPLLHGCTSVLYEGKPVRTPDAGAFWRVVADHGVQTMFTAPTAFRAIRREDPEAAMLERYDISRLRALFLAGERCDPNTLEWARRKLEIPVIDHWWQTESGWPMAANCLGVERLDIKPGSPTVAVPGYDVQVLDEHGAQVPAGDIGNIVVALPLPPGCLTTLWHDDERFVRSYMSTYPGYYLSGDAGFCDDDGYLWIMSRIDDIINVAGHRLSTGGMEEVLAEHPDVAECAVMGVKDELKGEIPLGLVVLESGVERDHATIAAELVARVRDAIGAVASFKKVAVVDQLPKTRSGKVLRGTMKKIADGVEYRMPATIDDPAVLEQIAAALAEIGYPA